MANYYYDEETGEYIRAEDFDPDEYEIVSAPTELAPEEDAPGSMLTHAYDATVGALNSASEFTGNALYSGILGIGEAAGGLFQGLGETGNLSTGVGRLSGLPPSVSSGLYGGIDRLAGEAGDDVAEFFSEKQEPAQEYRSELGTIPGYGFDVLQSTPSLLLSLMSGGAAPITAGLQVAGGETARRRDLGVGPDTAFGTAIGQGLLTAATSKLPFEQALSKGPLAQRVLATGALEGVQEGIDEAAVIAGDLATVDGFEITPGEAAKRVGYATAVGAGAGAIAPPIVDTTRALKRIVDGDAFVEAAMQQQPVETVAKEEILRSESTVAKPTYDVENIGPLDTSAPIVLKPPPTDKVDIDGTPADPSVEAVIVDPIATQDNSAERMAQFRVYEATELKVKESEKIAATLRGDERTISDVVNEINAEKAGKAKADVIPDIDKFLNGYLDIAHKKIKVPIFSDVVAGYRKQFIFMSTLGQLDSRAKAAYEESRNVGRNLAHETTSDAVAMAPYASLPNRTNVDNMLKQYANTGADIDYNKVAKKLSPDEMEAFKAYRNYYDNISIEKMRKHAERTVPENELYETSKTFRFIAEVETKLGKRIPFPLLTASRDIALKGKTDPQGALKDMQEVAAKIGEGGTQVVKAIMDLQTNAPRGLQAELTIQSMRKKNYVPAGRFGDYYTSVTNTNNEMLWFRRHSSAAEAAAQVKLFRQEGVIQPTDTIKVGQFRQVQDAAYDQNMPLSMAMQLAQLDPLYGEMLAKTLDLPPVGFAKHLERSKMIPGMDTDLLRGFADYSLGLNSFIEKSVSKQRFDKILNSIDTRSPLYKEMVDFKKYVYEDGDGKWANRLSRAITVYFLGYKLSSVALNWTQQLTATYGHSLALQKTLTGKSSDSYVIKEWLRAEKIAVEYATKPESLAKRDPELYDAIQSRVDGRDLDAQQLRDMIGLAKLGKLDKLNMFDRALIPFQIIEKMNRVQAYAMGYKIAKDAGRPAAMADEIAMKHVDETQYTYGRETTPKFFRGNLKVLFTLRGFQGHYIRMLRNQWGDKQYKAFTRSLGSMVALAGVKGVPLATQVFVVAKLFGLDVEDTLKKGSSMLYEGIFGDDDDNEAAFASALLYGLPTELTPITFHNQLGMGAMIDLEATPEEMAAAAIGGPLYGIFQRAYQAAGLAKQGKYYRALERISPPAVSSAMATFRGAGGATALGEPEGFLTANHNILVKDPSIWDLAAQLFSFTPASLFKARLVDQFRRDLTDNHNKKVSELNSRLGLLMAMGEYEQWTVEFTQSMLDGAVKVAEGKPEEAILPSQVGMNNAYLKIVNDKEYKLKNVKKQLRPAYKSGVNSITPNAYTD